MNKEKKWSEGLIFVITALWVLITLFWYIWFHGEHLRPYFHFIFLFSDFFVFIFLVLISLGVGRLVLVRLARFPAENLLEEILFSFSLGFAILSYTAMFLGFLGLLKFGVVLPLLIVYFTIGAFELRHIFSRLHTAFWNELKAAFSSFLTAFLLLILLLQAGMNLIDSFTPPYEWDTLSYHLFCQKEYVKSGKIFNLPYVHQSYYACGVELVYALCLLLRHHIAPKLLHCFLGIMTLLLIYALGRRFFGRKTALIAAAIFYTCPIPVWFSGVGKNDLGSVLFITLGFYAFLRWWELFTKAYVDKKPRKYWFFLTTIFTGISLHIDYRGFILLGVLLIFSGYHLLFKPTINRAELVRNLTFFLFVALLIGSPWYIRNYIYTDGGSPVYPFFTRQFGGISGNYFDQLILRLQQKYNAPPFSPTPPRSIWYYLSLPLWKFTILGRNYDLARFNAKVTPLYLILLPLFIFVNKPRVAQQLLALGLLYVVLTQLTRTAHTRYLAPIFPILALLSAYIADQGLLQKWQPIRNFLLAIVLVVCLALLYDNIITFFQHRSINYFLGIMRADEYVTLRTEIFPATNFINTELPKEAGLVFLSDERLYYCQRLAIPINAMRMARFISATQNQALTEWRKFLSDHGIGYILYNPGFHRRFEQLSAVSNLVDEFFTTFKKEHLEEIYNNHGIEIYKIKEAGKS